jgi:uncharacterized protein YjbJ (UPF0337 family)
MINAQELQGHWNQLKGQVKQKWGQLPDDDLAFADGNVDQLIGRIQQRTGEGREAVEGFLNQLLDKGSGGISAVAEHAREYVQGAGAALGEAGNRLREHYGDMADMAHERYMMAEDMVRHNPGRSLMVAFGVGMAVGLVVGLAGRSRA